MIPDERRYSHKWFYQCIQSRYGFNPHHLRLADACEFFIGQGCKVGLGGHLMGQKVTDQVAEMRSLPAGIDQRSPARHPDWLGPDDLALKIEEVREATNWEIPIQLKLGAARVGVLLANLGQLFDDLLFLGSLHSAPLTKTPALRRAERRRMPSSYRLGWTSAPVGPPTVSGDGRVLRGCCCLLQLLDDVAGTGRVDVDAGPHGRRQGDRPDVAALRGRRLRADDLLDNGCVVLQELPLAEAPLADRQVDVRTAIRGGGAFLAVAGDVAVGSARYRLFPDHAYAERIAVLPAHRGKGIAVALMAAFGGAGKALGIPDARVGVRASLPSNLRFYEDLGYRALASRPYPTGTDVEITLSKRLDA